MRGKYEDKDDWQQPPDFKNYEVTLVIVVHVIAEDEQDAITQSHEWFRSTDTNEINIADEEVLEE